jgi:ABC-2 type transport system ATP-binding protein
MSTPILDVRGLAYAYPDGHQALYGVDLHVHRGENVALLGPNGAGKTTLIRLLLGLAKPTRGTIRVLGHAVPETRAAALGRVGAIIEEPRFHPHLSGRENLRVHAAARDPDAHGRIGASLARVGLAAHADARVKTYSLGMRQRLGLAAALLGDPELLLLDEPANGLDPAGVHWLRGFLRRFAEQDRTVLVSSHVLAEVAQTVDQVVIIDRGRLLTTGSLADLTEQGRTLEDVYLELTAGGAS